MRRETARGKSEPRGWRHGSAQSRTDKKTVAFATAFPDLDVSGAPPAQATPSFFCKLDEEVVYWKVSRFSG